MTCGTFNSRFRDRLYLSIKQRVQLDLLFGQKPAPADETASEWLSVGAATVRLLLVRNRRARRYVLRVTKDGAARVTVPRGGSTVEARKFAAKNIAWLEKQLLRRASECSAAKPWLLGTEILFRGRLVRLESCVNGESGMIRFGDQDLRVNDPSGDLRPVLERYLRWLAVRELPHRVLELSALHQVPIRRVSVRNQRSRWGSCSRRGTISLNWRLIQAPEHVRDYIILHELAHAKQMNHSRRFWKEVARLCPGFEQAEAWLKQNGRRLR